MVGKGRSQIERDLVTKLGVPEPIYFLSKNSLMESTVCVEVQCHAAGSTCRGTILGSHDKPAISHFHNLEIKLLVDSLIRWKKVSMHYPSAVKETN
jgi:hypothetical protein